MDEQYFKTSYEYTKSLMTEITAAVGNTPVMVITIALEAIFVYQIIIAKTLGQALTSVILGVLIFVAFNFVLPRRFARQTMIQLKSQIKPGEKSITTWFNDQGITVRNEVIKEQGIVAYEDIDRVVETSNLIVIINKDKVASAINKNDMFAEEVEEAKNFLRDKGFEIRTKKRLSIF